MLNSRGHVGLTDMQNQPDGSLIYIDFKLPGLLHQVSTSSPLNVMLCTAKMSVIVEDVVECTHSTNRDIECVHSIK